MMRKKQVTNSYSVTAIWDSVVIKSPAVGGLTAYPLEDLAPRRAWIEDLSREKLRRQRSQHSVLL